MVIIILITYKDNTNNIILTVMLLLLRIEPTNSGCNQRNCLWIASHDRIDTRQPTEYYVLCSISIALFYILRIPTFNDNNILCWLTLLNSFYFSSNHSLLSSGSCSNAECCNRPNAMPVQHINQFIPKSE